LLSPAEADLARRDTAVPGLATVLDPDAFLDALGRAAPGKDLGRAEIAHVKYSPMTYCRVGYRVVVAGADCRLDVRACRHEDLATWLGRNGPTVPGPLGSGRLVLGESAVLVTVFPNDVKLPQIPYLTDPSLRGPLIRDLLPERPELWEAEIRCLRYWPGRRYAAELCAADGSRALLKAYTRNGYRRARRSAGVFRSRGPLRVARLLGFSDTDRLLAFEWLPGGMLSGFLTPELDREAVTATGAALAALHAQSPGALECWRREDETAYLFALSSEIGFVCPRLSARSDGLARRLASWLARAPVAQSPVHSDFSDAQVLIDGDRAAIVDLDSALCGDPADDLGSLLAQVEIHAQSGRMSRGRVETMTSALLEGYRRTANGAPMERIAPYTASGLLRRTRFAFRARRPDWEEITESSLDRAEAILNAHG
jgi:hypothetical protein